MFLKMQYRNMTTVLTREYLDARPDGWLEYAAKRIAQLYDIYCIPFEIHYFAFFKFCYWVTFEWEETYMNFILV